jgi:hypothetical protein
VARLAASRMTAADLARPFARRTVGPLVARLGAAVTTGNVVPAADLLADAVILLLDLALFSSIAAEALALARVAARAVMAAHGIAVVVGGRDNFVASDLDLMVAAWDGARDRGHAPDRGHILGFPTSG